MPCSTFQSCGGKFSDAATGEQVAFGTGKKKFGEIKENYGLSTVKKGGLKIWATF